MKKKMVSLLISLFSLFLLYNTFIFYRGRNIIQNKDIQGYSEEELLTVFHENQDLFLKTAIIIQRNNALKRKIISKNEDDWGIYSYADKQYFTEEEWAIIVELYKKTGPYMIMRSLKYGRDVVYFVFAETKQHETCWLFFVENGDGQTIKCYNGTGEKMRRIEKEWWIFSYFHKNQ